MSALNTLLLLQYNSYFNRIIDFETSYADYVHYSNKHYPITGYNFNPNDGVDTECIVNITEDWIPDYLVVFDSDNNLVSRWFVMEANRTRGKQYKLTIRRDVISDYYNSVVNSPILVEKGYVPSSNPLIFNKENFLCNQIKKDEKLLFDKTRLSWVILYYNLSKKSELHGTTTSIINYDYETFEHPIEQFYPTEQANGLKVPTNRQFKLIVSHSPTRYTIDNTVSRFLFNQDCVSAAYEGTEDLDKHLRCGLQPNLLYSWIDVNNILVHKLWEHRDVISSALETQFSAGNNFETLLNYNGKIIKDSNDNYYKIHFRPTSEISVEIQNLTSGDANTAITNALDLKTESTISATDPLWGDTTHGGLQSRITYTKYELVIESYNNSIPVFSFDFRNCRDIVDQPYGILALPYSSDGDYEIYSHPTAQNQLPLDKNVVINIVKELTKSGIGANSIIYDVQLLPYCPITTLSSYLRQNKLWMMTNFLDNTQKTFIYNNNDVIIGIALHPNTAKFTFNTISIRESAPSDIIDFKVNSQCNFVRLCSPNYNGIYEFSIEKNNGISYFNVDCTYKPYQPYIHINPDFKNLYGADFNDPRGLICGGDFSLTIITDAWETYKLQNKNYQEIFNRKIENMETTYDITNSQNVFNLLTGTAKGVGLGAIAGKNPAGMIVGGTAGLIQGIANIEYTKQQQAENIDYTTDVHELNLQNIQALPDTLTKVDAFNNNNKIFPVLEYYSCTDEEKEIFRKKIQYEGMTINTITTSLLNFKNPNEKTFIRGKLIRLRYLSEDNKLLEYIYQEMAKGVYL